MLQIVRTVNIPITSAPKICTCGVANTPFDIDIRMNNVHWEKAKLKAVLVVDYHAPVDPLLDYAEGKLHGAMDRTSLATSTPTAEAMSALTHAMGSLDQLVNFVDGIADVSASVVIEVRYRP